MKKIKILLATLVLTMVTTGGLCGCNSHNTTSTSTQPTKQEVKAVTKKVDKDYYINNLKYFQDGVIKASENPTEMKDQFISVCACINNIKNDKDGVQTLSVQTINIIEKFNDIARAITGQIPNHKDEKPLKFKIKYDPSKFGGIRVSDAKIGSFSNFIIKYESTDANNQPIFTALVAPFEMGYVQGADALCKCFAENNQPKPTLKTLDKTKFTGKKAKYNDNTEFIFQDVNTKKYYFTEMKLVDVEYQECDPAKDTLNAVAVVIKEVKDTGDDFEVVKDGTYKIYPLYLLDSSKVYEGYLKIVKRVFSYHLPR